MIRVDLSRAVGLRRLLERVARRLEDTGHPKIGAALRRGLPDVQARNAVSTSLSTRDPS